MKSRQDAQKLLEEWVKSDSLRKHCLSVAASMEKYAEKFGEDKDKWYLCGLLHDFDWEEYPNIDEHPIKGCQKLREEEYDEDIITAILGHNAKTGIKRYSLMAKTLFAVDELSGLVVALARVRPGNFDGMTAKSVRKALKKKDFAAAISRDDIRKGMEELGLKEDDLDGRNSHFELVISALSSKNKELGFGTA